MHVLISRLRALLFARLIIANRLRSASLALAVVVSAMTPGVALAQYLSISAPTPVAYDGAVDLTIRSTYPGPLEGLVYVDGQPFVSTPTTGNGATNLVRIYLGNVPGSHTFQLAGLDGVTTYLSNTITVTVTPKPKRPQTIAFTSPGTGLVNGTTDLSRIGVIRPRPDVHEPHAIHLLDERNHRDVRQCRHVHDRGRSAW